MSAIPFDNRVRGILVACAVLALALALSIRPAFAEDGKETLTARLVGEEEVPGPGDEDGKGKAKIEVFPELGEICFDIKVKRINLPASAAHIHPGAAGVANPPIVGLAPPDSSGRSSGCVSGVSPAVIEAILENPADFYVNVHNVDFPGGALRGQLKD